MADLSRESNLVAERREKTEFPHLQDPELADLQQVAEAPRLADGRDGDREVLPLPTTAGEVRCGLRRLKAHALLASFRGRPRGDTDAVVATALGLATYAHANRDGVREIDVNPLIVLEEGKGFFAVDAVVRKVSAPAPARGPGV
jgi:ATP-grasp domain